MKLTIRAFVLAVSVFVFNLHVQPAAQGQAPEARLICGEKVECQFILWNGGGSRGFVVQGIGSIGIGSAYNGFKFCMQAGPPHPPIPKWPECWGTYTAHWQKYGTIRPGDNG